jgi:hypothetical protein
VVHVRHADALRLAGDGVLRLLLRPDEQDGAAALPDRAREVVRVVDQLLRLLEVYDVDAAALGEDEALNIRVPAAGLMAEVDSGLQEVLHGDDGHGRPFLGLSWHCSGGLSVETGARARPPPPRPSAGSRDGS